MKGVIFNRATALNVWYAMLNLLIGIKKEHRLMMVLMLLWSIITNGFSSPEISTGINQSVPIMIVMSLMTFLILLYLSWWLLERFWQRVGLPGIGSMVSQYKEMTAWQQLGFYFSSFALLLLTGLGCMLAIL